MKKSKTSLLSAICLFSFLALNLSLKAESALPISIVSVHTEASLKNEGSLKEDLLIKFTAADSQVLKQPLILYINDKPYPALKAQTNILHTDNTLIFELGKVNDTLWSQFYSFKNLKAAVRIDVGTDRAKLTSSTKPNFMFLMSAKCVVTTGHIICILFFFLFLFLIFGKRSMLKDESCAVNKPYSLARFQLAWWTFVIVVSYILIYALKEDMNIVTTSALALLGISVTATGFARTIDYAQQNNDSGRHQNEESEGFLLDLLSDENGLSIHRFQNFVFTILFGLIFLYRIFKDCRMPEFGNMELALMGISSGTYVAVKSLENKAAPGTAGDGKASDVVVKDESLNSAKG